MPIKSTIIGSMIIAALSVAFEKLDTWQRNSEWVSHLERKGQMVSQPRRWLSACLLFVFSFLFFYQLITIVEYVFIPNCHTGRVADITQCQTNAGHKGRDV